MARYGTRAKIPELGQKSLGRNGRLRVDSKHVGSAIAVHEKGVASVRFQHNSAYPLLDEMETACPDTQTFIDPYLPHPRTTKRVLTERILLLGIQRMAGFGFFGPPIFDCEWDADHYDVHSDEKGVVLEGSAHYDSTNVARDRVDGALHVLGRMTATNLRAVFANVGQSHFAADVELGSRGFVEVPDGQTPASHMNKFVVLADAVTGDCWLYAA